MSRRTGSQQSHPALSPLSVSICMWPGGWPQLGGNGLRAHSLAEFPEGSGLLGKAVDMGQGCLCPACTVACLVCFLPL